MDRSPIPIHPQGTSPQTTLTREEWAHPQALKELRSAFAHYDEDDIKHALLATMNLFRWIAMETAERLGYPYPTKADEATKWIRTCLSQKGSVKQC